MQTHKSHFMVQDPHEFCFVWVGFYYNSHSYDFYVDLKAYSLPARADMSVGWF